MNSGRVRYRHGSELKPLSSEGLLLEKQRRKLSLLEVDVTAVTSESGSNRREDRSRGVIGAAVVVGVVVGKG